MPSTFRTTQIICIVLSFTALSASCGKSEKNDNDGPGAKKTSAVVPGNTSSANTSPNRPTAGTGSSGSKPKQAETNPPVSACSSNYKIVATANPFLADAPLATEIDYGSNSPKDTVPLSAPVSVQADDKKCFAAGRQLYFQVSGTIAHDDQPEIFSDADGQPDQVTSHMIGGVHGLSNISAPINSLVGVFLDDTAFAARPLAPAPLDFSLSESRNFRILAPKIGQIFFIGDGKDAAGLLQSFVVPAGTTRLYLAIMDEYEWSNNQGQLSGTIQWVKP
jgi:hypothetical protein